MEFLPRRFVTVWQIRLALIWALTLPLCRLPILFIFLSGIILLIGIGYLPLYRRSFRFVIVTKEIRVHSGVFLRRSRHLPVKSVYSAERSRTPLEMIFGLATVHVHGAGIRLTIPCLTVEQSLRFCLKAQVIIQ